MWPLEAIALYLEQNHEIQAEKSVLLQAIWPSEERCFTLS